MILGAAVQGRSQDARDRRLADAPMPAEDVAVSGAPLLKRVLQGAGDVLLSDDLRELLRTIFTGQDGITHEGEVSIIRDEFRFGHRTKVQSGKECGKQRIWGCEGGAQAVRCL